MYDGVVVVYVKGVVEGLFDKGKGVEVIRMRRGVDWRHRWKGG